MATQKSCLNNQASEKADLNSQELLSSSMAIWRLANKTYYRQILRFNKITDAKKKKDLLNAIHLAFEENKVEVKFARYAGRMPYDISIFKERYFNNLRKQIDEFRRYDDVALVNAKFKNF